MKIHIEHSVDHYRADCLDLPGSPPVGIGRTEALAMACLLFKLIHEHPGPHNTGSWLEFLKEGDPIVVNGEKWQWPKSYRNS